MKKDRLVGMAIIGGMTLCVVGLAGLIGLAVSKFKSWRQPHLLCPWASGILGDNERWSCPFSPSPSLFFCNLCCPPLYSPRTTTSHPLAPVINRKSCFGMSVNKIRLWLGKNQTNPSPKNNNKKKIVYKIFCFSTSFIESNVFDVSIFPSWKLYSFKYGTLLHSFLGRFSYLLLSIHLVDTIGDV